VENNVNEPRCDETTVIHLKYEQLNDSFISYRFVFVLVSMHKGPSLKVDLRNAELLTSCFSAHRVHL